MSPLLAGLGLSAVACLSYETSECPSGHLCPAGTQCVDVPGSEVSLCLLTEETYCTYQDPATEAPCAPGMACDDSNSRLCISLSQVKACVGKTDGDSCLLPGFSPVAPLECRFGVCVVPSCGDGLVFGVEDCDGEDLGGATCESQGFSFGILKCTPDCTMDVRGCSDATPIPAGELLMGSPPEESGRYDNETQHLVTLTHDFLLQTTEVTQAQFESVMGYNPSNWIACGPSCPVDTVSWHEVAAFMNRLSQADGLTPCYTCDGTGVDVDCSHSGAFASPYDCPGWRMPTEAEWEYAARAGDTRATYKGELPDEFCLQPNEALDFIAWFCGNSNSEPHPVGALQPNAWGLYDMLGNVWEWCLDWSSWDVDMYQDYPAGPVTNPVSIEGTVQIIRGGAWNGFAKLARAANRVQPGGNIPTRNQLLGARAARTLLE